ncbi:DUF7488 domain-containing protein [Helicobacter sp. T3_23-1059]
MIFGASCDMGSAIGRVCVGVARFVDFACAKCLANYRAKWLAKCRTKSLALCFCACGICLLSLVDSANAMSYAPCQNFYKQASASIDSKRVFSITHGGKPYLLAYSKTPLHSSKIIKKDIFLGLYLFSGKTPLSYNIKPIDSYANSLSLAGVNASSAVVGVVVSSGRGIFDLARFSKPLPKDSVISNVCFQIYGFYAYDNYFVPKALIDRFLSQKGGIYGDIGVRIIESSQSQNLALQNPANPKSSQTTNPKSPKSIIVEQVDIFFPNNPFLPKDRIISINGESVKSSVDFEWKVANLSPNSTAKVSIMRYGKPQTLEVKVLHRQGGGLLSDTFLERFGVWLDENLVIRSMKTPLPFNLSLLSEGDQLLWIDKVPIKRGDGFWHLRELLMRAWLNGKIELLILHEGVEAFVRSQMR